MVDELEPKPSDTMLQKSTYSAFQDTRLGLLLRKREVNTVLVVGLRSNTCARHTSADIFRRGYEVVFPEDCLEALPTRISERVSDTQTVYEVRIVGSKALAREREAVPDGTGSQPFT